MKRREESVPEPAGGGNLAGNGGESFPAHREGRSSERGEMGGSTRDLPTLPPRRCGSRPEWQLPSGVTRGLWEYADRSHVATDYDHYFAHNRLFDFDEQFLLREIQQRGGTPGQLVADLGCGTGRALVRLARHGFRGLAIDLSRHMLQVVREKAAREQLPIDVLRANLVELDCLADQGVDHACCLFSTLGMIRGRANRRQVLRHTRRILRPGGAFVLHVHNRWYNLYDPGGPWWLLQSYLQSVLRRDWEPGDKFFPYRGVQHMFLHVFTRGELAADLRSAGFVKQQWTPLDPRRHRALRWPHLAGRLRANGWIVVCS